MKNFLHSDGEGLPLETLESKDFVKLQSIFDHYHISNKSELIRFYQNKESARLQSHTGNSSESINTCRGFDQFDNDWILRLIRLRGGKDYVDDVLKARIKE
jgi:hypothetical protein